MKKKYKIQTWKLQIEGEYASEKYAIKTLSDKYMRCSKCDPPGEHFLELLAGKESKNRDTSNIAKYAFFYVWESVYGHEQWVMKYQLSIHPFKKSHWWENMDGSPFEFEECKFRYEIREPKKEEVEIKN